MIILTCILLYLLHLINAYTGLCARLIVNQINADRSEGSLSMFSGVLLIVIGLLEIPYGSILDLCRNLLTTSSSFTAS